MHTELVVITGCSSGLGRQTVKNLLATNKYHVVGAVRDVDKMEAVAEIEEFDMDNFHIMDCELNSFESVEKFCEELEEYQLGKPIDRLICNAGVYQPSLPYAKWSVDGHEQTMQINFLSHFLMVSKLIFFLTNVGFGFEFLGWSDEHVVLVLVLQAGVHHCGIGVRER